jgi:UPF0271 protein
LGRNLTFETDRKAIILDTSAFVAGFDPFSINEELYTVPKVREEITESSMAWMRLRTAIESGKLKVRSPKKVFVANARESATLVGDTFFLSETDLQVLALALELKRLGYSPLIATDDYSIQNVANQISIEFTSLATFGIRSQLQWVRYCPACRKRYSAKYKSKKCDICGTELKRKAVKKKAIF